MKASALLTAALLLATSPAYAQTEIGASERSPALAVALSIAPVALGAGVIAAGGENDISILVGVSTLVVGPSAGHFYAGSYGRGLLTIGARSAGLLMIGQSFAYSFDGPWCWNPCTDEDREAEAEAAKNDYLVAPLLIGGAVTFVGATLYDILDAAPAARRHNRSLSIAPTAMSSVSGTAPGLALAGTF